MNTIRKISAEIIPSCPIISHGSSPRRPFSLRIGVIFGCEVFTQRRRYALWFALRALLVTLRAREEKEVEIACLGVSRLLGEIRSTKKGANSWQRIHSKETDR